MKKYAVIGYGLEDSKLKNIHEAGFQEFDIEAIFENIELKPEELKDWITNEARNFAGFAVDHPYKESIREFIDSETEIVKKIGVVNTVSNIDGILVGTNTDSFGGLKSMLITVDPKDKKILILGANEDSKSIAFGLNTAESVVAIWGENTEKSAEISEKLDIGLVKDLDHLEGIIDRFDIIINTTKIGKKEWKSVFPAKFWLDNHTAFDIVNNPLQTKFLDDAESVGAEVISGDKFVIHQAIEQFKVWHDIQTEAEVFEEAFFL